MERFFVFLGYVWRVFANVISLAVVLYVFSRLNARLEVIVVSVLGLIYTTVRTIAFGQWSTTAGVSTLLAKELQDIKRLLGRDDPDDFAEAEKILWRRFAKGYTDLAFLAVISLLCIYQLLSAI